MSFTTQIKDLALQTGFDLVGITKAVPIPAAKERFLEWVGKGYAASMEYMSKDIERRLDPRLVLPSARSMICLAVNYYSPDHEASTPISVGSVGKVARYARGKDYHKVIEKMLKDLCAKIHEEVGEHVELKSYVDHGPILERAYAEQAGLGFIGKNGNLITQEFGSWVFLSEILTNLELEYDQPMKRGCYSCTRCLDACPTQAIIEPGTVDANRCISFLTIENRGEIPSVRKPQMKNLIFGCDICQEVCPYNQRAKLARVGALHPNQGAGEYISLTEVEEIQSEEDFNRIFAGSPIRRAKYLGLKRNAEVVSENLRSH